MIGQFTMRFAAPTKTVAIYPSFEVHPAERNLSQSQLTPRAIAWTEVDFVGRIGIVHLSGEPQVDQSMDRHRSQSALAAPEALEAIACLKGSDQMVEELMLGTMPQIWLAKPSAD